LGKLANNPNAANGWKPLVVSSTLLAAADWERYLAYFFDEEKHNVYVFSMKL
jgi:hypothetical protein